MNMKVLTTALCVLGATGTANAAFDETVDGGGEFGSTIGFAFDIGEFGSGVSTEIITGGITSGDVDWFAFTVANDANAEGAFTFGLIGGTSSIMFSDGASVLDFSAAGGSIAVTNLTAGTTYYVGVSGTGDGSSMSLFDGSHMEDFSYKLVVSASVAPVPMAAWAGLGLLIPMGIKRRMNRRG